MDFNEFISENFKKRKMGLVLDNSKEIIKVILIPTASRTKEEFHYVKKDKIELYKIGITKKNLFVYNLDKKLTYNKVRDCDVIYICGGNTFYLTAKMKEDGFDKVIKKLVKNNKIYVGVSAGSILAGPNIDIANPFDENDIGLKDWSGLKLTNRIVTPHFDNKEKEIIEQFKKKEKFQIIPITNNQALFVTKKENKIIE